jgi:hypothetical protein
MLLKSPICRQIWLLQMAAAKLHNTAVQALAAPAKEV